jgi:hypothetical protein
MALFIFAKEFIFGNLAKTAGKWANVLLSGTNFHSRHKLCSRSTRRSYSLGTFRSRNKRPEARSKLGAFFLASYLLLPASRTECPLTAYAKQSFARYINSLFSREQILFKEGNSK